MNKHFVTAAAIILAAAPAFARIEHIMPRPKSVVPAENARFATRRAVILDDPTQTSELRRFMEAVGLTDDKAATARITVKTGPVEDAYDYALAEYPNEAYSLTVSNDEITITAPTATGVIRAAQTLHIMAQEGDGFIEGATVTDWPAFKLRGFMHDVGRSFISLDELKREIDMLSRFKVNTFHWHLTDNTGWRLEIDAYPQLTGSAAITRYPGQFYTKAQAKELQDYAADRGVIIIPEIDMPGHSGPFERAMGHDMQSAQGIAELKVILAEVAALFDKAPYIHIGGDEKNFPDSYLVGMIDYVHSLGKKVVIWNRYNSPAISVNPKTMPCDMTTNWATAGTLSTGIPNIDMRYNYTNHFDLFADVVGIFKSSIFGVEKGNPDVAGTISAAWSDTKTPSEADIIRQNNVYANILASAERAWTGGGQQYIEQGGTTLPSSGSEHEEFADWERRFLYHKATTMAETAHLIPYVKQTNVCWNVTDQIPNSGNANAVLEPERYLADNVDVPTSFTINGATYKARTATGAGIYLRHIWHPTVKGFYDNPSNNMTAYAWTWVYSPEEQDAAALIEFYTYSRSGNEKAPDKGKWDRRGSRIWFNGEEIAAPVWQQPGASILQDQTQTGLTNENVTARPPVALHLRQGWNKVFMKLPHANNGGTGRDKWQFTFVITDPTGTDALDGLIYSPNKILDVEGERLMNAISEMTAWIDANVSNTPGYYPQSVTSDFNKVLNDILPTLDSELPAEERASQAKTLNDAFEAMKSAAKAAGIAQPADGGIYTLCTPLRFTRYATGKGAGKSIIGDETPSEASEWKFIKRSDNTFDIINTADGTFVSPQSANNTPLTTVTTQPSGGWTVKPADEVGYTIITCGSAQWNQTNNSGLQFAVFNWGGGSNISDTGCKYRFTTIHDPGTGISAVVTDNTDKTAADAMIYDLQGRKIIRPTSPGIYIINGKKTIVR